ncbi:MULTISPECIES: phage holin family protein [unclassified Haematobacter]|uniref:phage holin family protein n=1 Tax=unclassified Haematobacter TaxID=2640585 RepID=UPI0025C72B15|nr:MULTISPECIES: phage holin family protein [unclassified Haematobacter]
MLEQLTAGVKEAAVDAARKSLFSLVAGVLFCVGIAFLTAALWLFIERQSNALTAALGVALAYILAGIIVLLVGRNRDRAAHPGTPGVRAYDAPPPGGVGPGPRDPARAFASGSSVVPPLMEAFFFGLDSALRSRNGAPPPPPPPRDRY